MTLFRGILSLRVPRFPLLYIGLVTLLTLTPLLTMASLSLAISGFFASWTYLRFYKPVFPDLDSSQPTSLRGDPSESFALAEFFPAPARPFVAALSQTVFGILVSLRICSPFESTPGSAHGGGGYSLRSAPAPGSARAEAERRRALALKALDQRLSAATAAARAGTGASQAPAGSGAASASPAPPPNQPTGPTVQSQPKPGAQNTMTQPLGETSYNPDDSGDKS